jgi:large subunit ribosomal protein L18
MKKKIKKLYLQQKKRYLKKITGTIEKPRLSIFKSHNHIYAQLIDDKNAHTLVCSSTLNKNLKEILINNLKKQASFLVGQDLAKKALKKQIKIIAFDRGNYSYHGRIKSLVEGSREQGLVF